MDSAGIGLTVADKSLSLVITKLHSPDQQVSFVTSSKHKLMSSVDSYRINLKSLIVVSKVTWIKLHDKRFANLMALSGSSYLLFFIIRLDVVKVIDPHSTIITASEEDGLRVWNNKDVVNWFLGLAMSVKLVDQHQSFEVPDKNSAIFAGNNDEAITIAYDEVCDDVSLSV